MKIVAAILVSFIISFAIAADFKTYSVVRADGTTKCRREIKTTYYPNVINPRGIRIRSLRSCTRDNALRRTNLFFDINTVGRPDIQVAFFRAIRDDDDTLTAFSYFRIFFERVIEYEEKNGVPGYQPGLGINDDKPRAIDFLSTKQWNPITTTNTDVGDGATVHTFTASTVDGEVTFDIHFTTDYLVGPNRTVIVPHSAKFDFKITNHTYTDALASGLAFRVFVVARGRTREKAKTDTDTELDLEDQKAVSINDDGSYFTWNNYVTERTQGDVTIYDHSLSYDADKTDANTLLTQDARLHVSTIWFSVPNRPVNLVWDPYVGFADNYNSATSAALSFALLLLAALIAM